MIEVEGLVQWVIQNKNWLFSGAGVVIITSIIAYLRRSGKNEVPEKNNSVEISDSEVVGGVAGGDITVSEEVNDNDE
ncbi:hypothetical protein ACFQJ7_06125 [Halovenus rubra]|uniref:Uncharacterized protein n=2 Tax=Halovenus rubra TaxID=869890 RepID=A0ABD5X7S0_9EURY|nr:hypothetical protein [Halovenus rubra]